MVQISTSWCQGRNVAPEEVGMDTLQWGKADYQVREMQKTGECPPPLPRQGAHKIKQQQ